MLEGLKAAFPDTKITYVPGTQFLGGDGVPIPDDLLSITDGKHGLRAEYRGEEGMELAPGKTPKPFFTRLEPNVNLNQKTLPEDAKKTKMLNVEWNGFLMPPDSGDYLIGFRADGNASLKVDGKEVAQEFRTHGIESKLGRVHLLKGEKVSLSLRYGEINADPPVAQLIWARVDNEPSSEAIAAARQADVVVAVVGITSQLEGEEMPVSEPGFLGGDRTSIDLPAPEEALVEAVAHTGKPLVVVLMNGSALAVNWIHDHANSILEAWYSGEEGGTAIADTLVGKNNPAGKLPVTFYRDVSQLPNFEDYSMDNRTYRYFSGKPLYPFGYGLSYTTFRFSNLNLPQTSVGAVEPLNASVTVTNTGTVAGDEVAQLYLQFPQVAGAPHIALRGFQRVHLAPGESKQVHFELNQRDLSMVTETGQPIVAAGEYTLSIGGGQPGTDAAVVSGQFHIDGQIALSQ